MSKILTNTTSEDIFIQDCGTTVLANSFIEIEENWESIFARSSDVVPYVLDGSLKVSNSKRELPNPGLAIKELQSEGLAETFPFDNTVNGFVSEKIQEAIEEVEQNKQPLSDDLTAISSISGSGIVVRENENSWKTRTLQAISPILISNEGGEVENPTVSHAESGVDSGNYGSSTKIPQIAVDNKGHITSISLADNIPSFLNYNTVSATNEVSTSSTTYQNISNMTYVPVAGTYLVIWSGNVYTSRSASDSYGKYRLAVDNVGVASSVRESRVLVQLLLGLIGNTSVNGSAGSLLDIITVNGSQTVTMQFCVDNSAITTYAKERRLIFLRIA